MGHQSKIMMSCQIVVFMLWLYLFGLGKCLQTENFLANENSQGYSKQLLLKTMERYFPELDLHDDEILADIVGSDKGQQLLRNAAVKEVKGRLESEQNERGKSAKEILSDESYCSYIWLSWLPWLSCPEETREITPLRYYQERLCN